MPHIPSFLVGAGVSSVIFLAIHEQLSHRSRLSKKWKLREMAEEQARIMFTKDPKSKSLQSEPFSLTKTWNKGVSYVQNLLQRD